MFGLPDCFSSLSLEFLSMTSKQTSVPISSPPPSLPPPPLFTMVTSIFPPSRAVMPGKDFTDGPAASPAFPTVVAAILHHIISTPTAIAAVDHSTPEPESITYNELGTRAIRLAKLLKNAGVRPGDRVPLVVRRGIDMIVGIVGVLCCGAQYIPLDGNVVATEALRTVVQQSQSAAILCLKSTQGRFTDLDVGGRALIAIDTVPLGTDVSLIGIISEALQLVTPDSGCYVIYTSGMAI